MNPLQSLPSYEQFIYSFSQESPLIVRSTLVVIRRGATIAAVTGEMEFSNGIRLVVGEKLSFAQSPGQIKGYGYEVWRGNEQLYWYDSQPHPHDTILAGTDPHYKHIPPDIKHHRIPAPELAFNKPNLLSLISEIQELPEDA